MVGYWLLYDYVLCFFDPMTMYFVCITHEYCFISAATTAQDFIQVPNEPYNSNFQYKILLLEGIALWTLCVSK